MTTIEVPTWAVLVIVTYVVLQTGVAVFVMLRILTAAITEIRKNDRADKAAAAAVARATPGIIAQIERLERTFGDYRGALRTIAEMKPAIALRDGAEAAALLDRARMLASNALLVQRPTAAPPSSNV